MSPDAAGARPTGGRVIDHDQAVAAAHRRFLADGDLDMQTLADELAVGRATLYRVVGNRDQLLGDVLWGLARRTLSLALSEADEDAPAVDRVLAASTAFARYVAGFEPLQHLLRSDSPTAFRVLFTPAGQVHERMVEAWAGIFRGLAAAGELTLPFDADKLAYIHVRIGESMLYADVLAGREPDIDLAAMIRRAVLEMDPRERGAGAD